jgi:hypothetical protein
VRDGAHRRIVVARQLADLAGREPRGDGVGEHVDARVVFSAQGSFE